MRLATLAALALLTAGSMPASTTFATFIPYGGSVLQWGGACTTGCTADVELNYIGGIKNNAPYNATLLGTLNYNWAPIGPVTSQTFFGQPAYTQEVVGNFSFSYVSPGGTENLVTVDFSAAPGELTYVGFFGDLAFRLDPTTSGAIAPGMTSDIVAFAPGGLTDWTFGIDFGNKNPGFAAGGNINPFTSTLGFNGTIGASPLPAGQIPEPASMLMAGAGLLAVGGLLRLRKRIRK